MRRPEWQPDGEFGAAARSAFDGDRTFVKPYELVNKGQAYAGSLMRAPAGTFDSMEAFEDM